MNHYRPLGRTSTAKVVSASAESEHGGPSEPPATPQRRPWLDNSKRVPELHSNGWEYDIDVHIEETNVIEIDAPGAQPVRVIIYDGEWVIERRIEGTEPGATTWVECARFPLDGEIR